MEPTTFAFAVATLFFSNLLKEGAKRWAKVSRSWLEI
jgi:hypothetical protein